MDMKCHSFGYIALVAKQLSIFRFMAPNRVILQSNQSYLKLIRAVVIHYIGLSWMIATKDQNNASVDKLYEEWCKIGPRFYEIFFQNLLGPLFDGFFVTVCQYRYDLMCGLYAYDKRK